MSGGDIDETALFLVTMAAFCIVLELAFRLGRRRLARDGYADTEAVRVHLRTLQSALLGLLSLLLGFSFAMAATRFDARKALILEEVNAIDTTYLRAQLLPEASRRELTSLVRAYATSRIELLRAGDNQSLLDAASAAGTGITTRLWSTATATAANAQSPAQIMFVLQSIGDIINVGEKRRAALDNHVPRTVIGLLFGVALGAMGFIAYGHGLMSPRRHGSSVLFALLIAVVFTIIVDLDRPRTGFIIVGEEGLVRLKEMLDREPT